LVLQVGDDGPVSPISASSPTVMNMIMMAQPTLPVPPLVTPISTYASLVDPEEGTDLKFMPTIVVNGLKCAQLLNEDVDDEIAYW